MPAKIGKQGVNYVTTSKNCYVIIRLSLTLTRLSNTVISKRVGNKGKESPKAFNRVNITKQNFRDVYVTLVEDDCPESEASSGRGCWGD